MKRFLQTHYPNISFVLLTLFIITLPLKNNFNSLSIILLSVFAFLVFVLKKQFDLKLFYKFLPLLLFYVLTALSVLYSTDVDTGLKMILRLLPFVLLPFIFSIIQLRKKTVFKLLKGYVFWMLLLCLYSHSQVLIKLFKNDDILYNIFLNYYSYKSLANDTIGLHTTYYAYYIIVAVVFLMYFLFHEPRLKRRIFYFVILGYFTFFVFHISARTPIFVLFLFYNFAILYYFFKRKRIKQGIFILLLFYFVSSIAVYNVRITRYRFQHLFGFTYASGVHHDDGLDKLLQWKSSAMANNNVLFGEGIGDANQQIFKSYRIYGLDTYAERGYNAHNQFIQTYVELGLVGLLLLLFIFGYYFSIFYRNRQLIPAVLLLLTFILYQTESYLQRHNGIVLFLFLICLFLNEEKKDSYEKN